MRHVCRKPLDDAGIHAMTCPNGGRMCQRHDAIRNWLAEECRDRCHLKVLSLIHISEPTRLDVI
eukprot:7406567-Prorocentrum_lima.AAC.1